MYRSVLALITVIAADKGYVYPEGDFTDKWANCRDKLPPTIMITTNPSLGQEHFSEIQICPWYMIKMRGYKISDWKDLYQVAWGSVAKVVMDPIAAMVYTPIDADTLPDKVILHEVHASFPILSKTNFMSS